jgi:hypothetical protein
MPGFVFRRNAKDLVQKRRVVQLDIDAPILQGPGGLGYVDHFARGGARIAEKGEARTHEGCPDSARLDAVQSLAERGIARLAWFRSLT